MSFHTPSQAEPMNYQGLVPIANTITAVMVDGDFFLKRYRAIRGPGHGPEEIAKNLHKMCLAHMTEKGQRTRHLYRIFFYDCPPLQKKAHHPLTGEAIDFSRTHQAQFRKDFHYHLKKLRKVAIRLGYLDENNARWSLSEDKVRALAAKTITLEDLTPEDFSYQFRQKGVDMRIGMDIASLAFKRLVNHIVLVAGDSDFVPAAKLARREGIDFVLDSMGQPVRADLFEHIDGLRTVLKPYPTQRRPSESFAMSTMEDDL